MTIYRRRTSCDCTDAEDGLWGILKGDEIFGGFEILLDDSVVNV